MKISFLMIVKTEIGLLDDSCGPPKCNSLHGSYHLRLVGAVHPHMFGIFGPGQGPQRAEAIGRNSDRTNAGVRRERSGNYEGLPTAVAQLNDVREG